MSEVFCRVCGLPLDEDPWGEDGKTPNYTICPCCGVDLDTKIIRPNCSGHIEKNGSTVVVNGLTRV